MTAIPLPTDRASRVLRLQALCAEELLEPGVLGRVAMLQRETEALLDRADLDLKALKAALPPA